MNLHYHEVAMIAVRRGVNPFWFDRIASMARHCSLTSGGRLPGCTIGRGFKAIRVAKKWPLRGSITITREDDRKFRLYMTTSEFKVREVTR